MTFDSSLRKVAIALYASLDSPRALTASILLRYGEWDQLATLAIDPHNYLEGPWGARKFARDAQATDFLRKSPLLPTSINRVQVAKDAFYDSERQCLLTNQFLRLLAYPSDGPTARYEDRLRAVLAGARKIASRILGRLPDDLEGRFGPGTSFELKGSTFTTAADKLWITPHSTSSNMPVFEHTYWRTHWGRSRLARDLPLPSLARGNRFTTVPKDATKDRGICVEPLGNLWVQLGIGGYLKRRLRQVGIHVDRVSHTRSLFNLHQSGPPDEGQEIHRRMARDASLSGEWATIDLSNASDTVAYELVRAVLPPDWFMLLDSARSPMTQINGKWHLLDKFSSMGNGFTFELETLIFLSILSAVTGCVSGEDLFVYGDDIIIPTKHAKDAMAILTACGFQPNMKKSFTSGPFRESCGGDFFSGFPVRSYFAKGEFESPLEWIGMHNRLLELWPKAIVARKRCVDPLPSRLRVFGPVQLGDRVLHGRPLRFWVRDGIRWLATVEPIPVKIALDRWGEAFTLTLALLGVPSSGLTPRGPPSGYRISEASIS